MVLESVIFISLYMLAMTAYSQKGVGDATGIGRQRLAPEIVLLKGTVEAVKSGDCKNTTGRSVLGTHLMLATEEAKTLNIHLGPTAEVSEWVKGIEGKGIEVKAFRTKKLPRDQYIAKELIVQGQTAVLRDDTLKPFWAGSSWCGRKRGYGKGYCRR